MREALVHKHAWAAIFTLTFIPLAANFLALLAIGRELFFLLLALNAFFLLALFSKVEAKIDVVLSLLIIAAVCSILRPLNPQVLHGIESMAITYALFCFAAWLLLCALDFVKSPEQFFSKVKMMVSETLAEFRPRPESRIRVGLKVAELDEAKVRLGESFMKSDWQKLMLKEHRKKEFEWRPASSEFIIDPLSEANPHTNISGVSGYGKSTLCKVIAKGIWEQYSLPVIILDLHNEYGELIRGIGGEVLDPASTSLGVWELENEAPAQKISENIGIFDYVLSLGDIQSYFLSKAAEKAYTRKKMSLDKTVASEHTTSMKDIIEAADEWLGSQKRPDKSLVGLRRRLSLLELTGAFSQKTTIPFREILSKPTCIELGSLRSPQAQTLYTEVFLRKLYNYMLREGKINGVKLFVLIDEAQNVCKAGKEGSFAGKITAEARKYGIGLITSNQMAQDLDKAIIANSAISFAFYQKEPHETNYIIELMTGPDYEKKIALNRRFSQLQKFECIAITTKQRKPALIKIRPLELAKGTHEKQGAKTGTDGKTGQATGQDTGLGMVEEVATKKKAGKTDDKENMIEMITQALNEKKIEYTRHHTKHEPDIEVRRNGKKIGLQVETEKKKIYKIREQAKNKLKKYDALILIVGPELEQHYKKAAFGTKAEVKTVNEYIKSLE